MFGIGLPEFGVIALVALLLLGPDKLPGLAKQAGGMLRTARRFADSARDELREQLGPEHADLELRDLDPRELVRKKIAEAMADAEDDAADAAEDAAEEQARR